MQVLRQVHSLFLPVKPLERGSTRFCSVRALCWQEHRRLRLLSQVFSSCPASRLLLSQAFVWLGKEWYCEAGLASWGQGGSVEPRQDRTQLLLEMQEHQHLSNSSGQQVFPPPPMSPPIPPPPQSLGASKRQRRRRVGLENNICWILNTWVKLTKNYEHTFRLG